jgi:predicted ribosomally synthesized peptide with nif11-like leader
MEAAVTFYERLEKEPELQEQLKELETPERVQVYVRDELGYDFTREEMQKVVFERHPEMTDEELEAVTGGFALASTISVVMIWVMFYAISAA